MIVYKTDMKSIPNNCMECDFVNCTIPCKRNGRGGNTDFIKKAYTKKRPKECPLMEVEDASKEEISKART